MAGLALIYDSDQPVPQSIFSAFLGATANFKRLTAPADTVTSKHCLAAKLDAPCSLHRGILRHAQLGAWLLAAGTLIDSPDLQPDGSLDGLLRDYLERGNDVLSRLDGQFALAIYNPHLEQVAIISDPLGMIPIYYGQSGGRYYFSTSALAVAKMLQPAPDMLHMRAFLLYGDQLDGTFWQGVQRVPPATVFELSPAGSRQSTYWSFEVDPEIAGYSEDRALDCILEGFSGSIRQALAREGKMWLSLTGGLDSRTLAGLVSHNNLPFKAYCHGLVDSRDVQIAERISRAMGWEYEYFPLPEDWGSQRVEWLTRAVGQTDGGLGALKLARTIREQTLKAGQSGVSLWGYGGEVYRGYYWKQEFWRAGVTSQVDYDRLIDFRLSPLEVDVLADGPHWQAVLREMFRDTYRTIGERQPHWPNTVKLDLIGLRLERQSCGGTIAAVLGQQRVPLPFDFKENLQRAISVNYRWRTHSRLFRKLLERANPRLAAMETADGGPALPMRLTNAHRFIPYWLNTGEKLIWKLGYKHLRKALWRKRNPGQDGRAYPVGRWLKETVSRLEEKGILKLENMHSAALYQPQRFAMRLDMSQPYSMAWETLISRIISVEMALRLAGTDSFS